MARPPLDIDEDQVEKLASMGCKIEEIASFFKCSRDTIERRFAANLEFGRANLCVSLRKWQLECAKKGNVTMLIWLGKQILKQREQEVSVTTNSEDSSLTIVLSKDAS